MPKDQEDYGRRLLKHAMERIVDEELPLGACGKVIVRLVNELVSEIAVKAFDGQLVHPRLEDRCCAHCDEWIGSGHRLINYSGEYKNFVGICKYLKRTYPTELRNWVTIAHHNGGCGQFICAERCPKCFKPFACRTDGTGALNTAECFKCGWTMCGDRTDNDGSESKRNQD